ncbi:hypothetical protein BJ875DRAFT_525635 [Amylocarpus encephaloides]|uniref:BTB domain-containing protein n=1 Tax=Amylocarpus encephaloides TaxID=45428 RepID=A0A9P8C0B7_9HELO|nr:hypothetical protein BJ875DRAFT_525635 [Amylocarpus encephaloides]
MFPPYKILVDNEHYPKTAEVERVSATATREDFVFEGGDVEILVQIANGDIIHGRVCSQVLCLASPVWKKFIFPPYQPLSTLQETSSGTQAHNSACLGEKPLAILDFTEDNPEALKTIFNLAHLRRYGGDIFSPIPVDKLHQIAILVDEYDCLDTVLRYLPYWLPRNRYSEEGAWIKPGNEEWLFISWVFGQSFMFRGIATRLTLELCVDLNGDLVLDDRYDTPLLEPVPADILESIYEARRSALRSLHTILRTGLEDLGDKRKICCHLQDKCCDMYVRSTIAKILASNGLFPLNEERDGCYKGGVTNFASFVDEILELAFKNQNATPKKHRQHPKDPQEKDSTLKTTGQNITKMAQLLLNTRKTPKPSARVKDIWRLPDKSEQSEGGPHSKCHQSLKAKFQRRFQEIPEEIRGSVLLEPHKRHLNRAFSKFTLQSEINDHVQMY